MFVPGGEAARRAVLNDGRQAGRRCVGVYVRVGRVCIFISVGENATRSYMQQSWLAWGCDSMVLVVKVFCSVCGVIAWGWCGGSVVWGLRGG